MNLGVGLLMINKPGIYGFMFIAHGKISCNGYMPLSINWRGFMT